MLRIAYRIQPSLIAGAGRGLFAIEDVSAGRVIVAPAGIDRTVDLAYLEALPIDHPELHSSVRWFEDAYTVAPDWPDECYLNHAFTANGLWHLGFVFAAVDIACGEEITIDYRHLLATGVDNGFAVAATGRRIVGLGWRENALTSTRALLRILENAA